MLRANSFTIYNLKKNEVLFQVHVKQELYQTNMNQN
jgi:hypothetical protein